MTALVYVFGSTHADTSYSISEPPAPGQTVIAASAAFSLGGKGADQAIAAVAGGSPRLIGAVGHDSEATSLRVALALRGVDMNAIDAFSEAMTGSAIVYVNDAGENSPVELSSANGLLTESIASRGLATISEGDVVVLQSEVPASANCAAAMIARSAGAEMACIAAPVPTSTVELVRNINLLVVNQHDSVQVATVFDIHEVGVGFIMTKLAALLAATATALSAALGSDRVFSVAGGSSIHVAAPKVYASDTTGAEDTVVGDLAAHSDLPIAERLTLAVTAVALTVPREAASSSIPPVSNVELMFADLTERNSA